MATATVKSTYALDLETVRALEEMACGWGVSKSEALRRAIRSARLESGSGMPTALAALDELQHSLELTGVTAGSWEKKARAERHATSLRREPR